MIEFYDFGEIMIDGRTYHTDVIIYPDKVKPDWWRKEGHYLQPFDIMPEIAAKPDHLVIGTGFNGVMRVAPETEKRLQEFGIAYTIESSRFAVKTFNRMLEQNIQVIAAIHLTC